ncbi:MAG: acyl-homoserine-lactone synthase [Pseudomonadota bacterium]
MHNITFDMSVMHLHGPVFYDFLRLRKAFFVDTLAWDIPHNDDVEMDQYDNPEAKYSVVVRNGHVVGGARTMSANVRWGEHTCMLQDAIAGRLPGIPADILGHQVNSDDIWECTRLVISNSVKSQKERTRCLALIVDGLVTMAKAEGARELVSISPLPLMRALRRLGHGATRIGDPYVNPGDARTYAVLKMPAERSAAMVAEHAPAFAEAS